ncbi:peptide ABC transporter permease [Streptomyces paromomycinus]|uniref:Peptide ABC transporter permease n=1 Tax=Streptomyces paromomycinus TaxID=92743 RepID=A0A401VZD4_STREY|nr:peptide ABC transporter permease [Streptomyces paromomycinus]
MRKREGMAGRWPGLLRKPARTAGRRWPGLTRLTRRAARTAGRRRSGLAGLLIAGVPLLLALLGPLLAGEPGPRSASFTLGGGHWLGTDFVGRDVGRQILLGGQSVVLVALAATALAYAVAVPLGLAAALTHRTWLEELLMRPLDVLLAVPSLLLILLVAAVFSPGAAGLALLVALVNIPDAARIVRAAVSEAAARPAVEALRMQGETWWRTAIGYVGRSALRTFAADAGVRLTGVLYLVATAAFLGVGVEPDAADWAVMVDRNRTGLFVQPWAVVVPALLIVGLSMGGNLVVDAVLGGEGRRSEAAKRDACDGPDAPRAPDVPDAPQAPDGPDACDAPDGPDVTDMSDVADVKEGHR